MHIADYVILGIFALIVAGSIYAIYRSKKKGNKCIGCPDGGNCARNCSGCSGGCIHKK